METVAEAGSHRGERVGNVANGVEQADVSDALEVRHVLVGVVLDELRDGREVLVL